MLHSVRIHAKKKSLRELRGEILRALCELTEGVEAEDEQVIVRCEELWAQCELLAEGVHDRDSMLRKVFFFHRGCREWLWIDICA